MTELDLWNVITVTLLFTNVTSNDLTNNECYKNPPVAAIAAYEQIHLGSGLGVPEIWYRDNEWNNTEYISRMQTLHPHWPQCLKYPPISDITTNVPCKEYCKWHYDVARKLQNRLSKEIITICNKQFIEKAQNDIQKYAEFWDHATWVYQNFNILHKRQWLNRMRELFPIEYNCIYMLDAVPPYLVQRD